MWFMEIQGTLAVATKGAKATDQDTCCLTDNKPGCPVTIVDKMIKIKISKLDHI